MSKFSYDVLSVEAADALRASADRIRSLMRRSIADLGRELTDAKRRLSHGQFEQWLKAEFDIKPRSAQYAMRVAELIDKNEKFALLGRSALYLLASPKVPESAHRAVETMIDSGENPSYAKVKAIAQQRSGSAVSLASGIRGGYVASDSVVPLRAEDSPSNFRADVEVADIALYLTQKLGSLDAADLIELCEKVPPTVPIRLLAQALKAAPPITGSAELEFVPG